MRLVGALTRVLLTLLGLVALGARSNGTLRLEDTHLLASRIQIAFRKELVLMSLFQYNSETKDLSANIRFNWIPKPGSDFFIVYNELDEWSHVFHFKNRSLVVKLNHLFAF